ncbi:nucleoside hydrolase-like domain-containing protein [Alteriqipengyuania sp.]|uniref:DUF1593 domain-containing protein n=1 Tax=Alteriqipengyuania sp. TaxID=2800692 RepID=UPI003515F70A
MKSGLVWALTLLVCASPVSAAQPVTTSPETSTGKTRLFVLTDIEADPDDTQSLIRLLLYANEIDIEGLVATTSVHKKSAPAPASIRYVIENYAKVRDNLIQHDPAYPSADTLAGLVDAGQPIYGMAGVGEGKDSAGSQALIAALERPDPRPLWVTAWGGPNTLAQALHTIRATRSPQDADRLISKLRVYTISDQDDSGPWMREQFPGLFYIVSPGGYGAATWTGMSAVVANFDNTTISNTWIADNIQQGHGPFGAAYPDVAYGMEGDIPSFLGLIPNGLNAPDRPDWGGWGGRYALRTPAREETDPDGFTGGVPVPPETRPIWTNSDDRVTPFRKSDFGVAIAPMDRSYSGFRETIWRWRNDFQNDFAARMDWTVRGPAEANHPPQVRVVTPARIKVRSGQHVGLNAFGTTDPDGDSLSYQWFEYPEAGTCPATATFSGADNLYERGFTAPEVDRKCELHFILRVTDKGSPPLTRYARVVATVSP